MMTNNRLFAVSNVCLALGICLGLGACDDDIDAPEDDTTPVETSDGGTEGSGGEPDPSGGATSGPDDTTGTTSGNDGTDTGSEGESGEGESGGTTGDPADALSFEADVWDIISANCGCHTGGAAGGLAMTDAATAYDNLVGSGDHVEPGDPDASYLWAKLIGGTPENPIEGTIMPPTGMLPAQDLDVIETWILDGAQP